MSASTSTSASQGLAPSVVRERLRELAMNLWWTWNEIAQRPFAALDPVLWEATKRCPIRLLDLVDDARVSAAGSDHSFLTVLEDARVATVAAMERKPWFVRVAKPKEKTLRVAYFCSEFAIHESLQQYSGGLGVLAGDHVKSCSDLGIPFVGMGLLYRHGYYIQEFTEEGDTRVLYPRYDFRLMPLVETGVRIHCPINGRDVEARIWRMQVGRSTVYLLDADLPSNHPEDRILTEGLYKGEPELRMRQQILLGVGGTIALAALKEPVTVYHLNEGHAAFCCIERVARFVESGMPLEQASARVLASTVFTTHTPVPAGHDRYDPTVAAAALQSVLDRAGLGARQFADLGRERPGDPTELFCMTVLALRHAAQVNGVAALHGRVSREMWKSVYGVANAKDVPIGHITNGVHPRTWLHPEAETFWRRQIGLDLDDGTPAVSRWADAKDASPEDFWNLRTSLRRQLIHFVRGRLVEAACKRGDGAEGAAEAVSTLREDALTIGFARRFATYKRAPLIFRDLRRLTDLLADDERPVQIIFAGKAHPRDKGGQEYAKQIYQLMRSEGLRGKVVLVEEYDMRVGRALVSGCDVWLNNPIRPHEASGTSGMKPPMHGGINCSILDGWWPEGYDGKNGWAIGTEDETESDQNRRDARDAESLYDLLEYEIIPEFYDRNRKGLPTKWIRRALRSASTVPSVFNTHRMVGEYLAKYYVPAHLG
ncbi:MAG: alpha-glucan family phosphorylase [Phycisphaerae bacterium]|nr:alpha-glucan family phosphorylase [Phycisphaerae bacterium]